MPTLRGVSMMPKRVTKRNNDKFFTEKRCLKLKFSLFKTLDDNFYRLKRGNER